MYSFTLLLHSLGRWLVLISLIGAIIIAVKNLQQQSTFTDRIDTWRHWTATIAHIQLLLGMFCYFQSPIVKYSLPKDPQHIINEHVYFRYIHISLMLIAVILITIGSAKAKRQQTDRAKFKTMLIWFSIALLILLIAIPWPFSPLTGRPLLRNF